MNDDAPVLVAGATGFVGRRLTRALEEAGRRPGDDPPPRRLRRPRRAGARRRARRLDAAGRARGLLGRLLPALLGSADFERLDAEAAKAFGEAAAEVGLEQIVYLGGLGDDSDELSAHLRSRREVEGLLGAATVLRAGIVIGAGGISWR